MTHPLYILASVAVVSLISLTGIFFLAARRRLFDRALILFVSFAAGSMLAAVFFDLIPEAIEELSVEAVMPAILFGITVFFIIERLLHWHHFHATADQAHPLTYLNVIGDGMHNFMDGVAIAAAYLVDIPAGIATTLAVAVHEIPQEVSDFSLLVYGGWSKRKALLFNFLSALTAFLGAGLVLLVAETVQEVVPVLAGIAAGGLLYIATADLVPELHKERNLKKIALQLAAFVLGIYVISLLTAGGH